MHIFGLNLNATNATKCVSGFPRKMQGLAAGRAIEGRLTLAQLANNFTALPPCVYCNSVILIYLYVCVLILWGIWQEKGTNLGRGAWNRKDQCSLGRIQYCMPTLCSRQSDQWTTFGISSSTFLSWFLEPMTTLFKLSLDQASDWCCSFTREKFHPWRILFQN